MSDQILLRGGRVVDPSQSLDAVRDILVAEGRIAKVGEGLDASADTRVVECGGLPELFYNHALPITGDLPCVGRRDAEVRMSRIAAVGE